MNDQQLNFDIKTFKLAVIVVKALISCSVEPPPMIFCKMRNIESFITAAAPGPVWVSPPTPFFQSQPGNLDMGPNEFVLVLLLVRNVQRRRNFVNVDNRWKFFGS